MDENINDETRPSITDGNVEGLLDRVLRTGLTFKTTATFAGWVQRIEADSPHVVNDLRVLHHLERYWFAKDFLMSMGLKNSTIIDVGIGEALGINEFLRDLPSSMIERVIGLEIDKEIANRAQVQYPLIEIINTNVEEFNTTDLFDIVFCYELLGHQSLSSDHVLLQRLDKLCASDGHIFLSSKVFSGVENGYARKKDYDARIYDTRAFVDLVRHNFPDYSIRFFGQIYPLKRMSQHTVGVWENPRLDRDANFLICVAKKQKKTESLPTQIMQPMVND